MMIIVELTWHYVNSACG